jgi:hypothetical protein
VQASSESAIATPATAASAELNSSPTTVNNNHVKYSAASSLLCGNKEAVAALNSAAAVASVVTPPPPPLPLSRTNSSDSLSSQQPASFRFPTVPGNHSAIPCKWEGCGQGFKTHGKLSDHIKTAHMAPQLEGTEVKEYSCLWLDCKVT